MGGVIVMESLQKLIPLARTAADLLRARAETVAVAESSAGGLVSAALLAIPGASAYFLGGAVVYTRQARDVFLDIPDQALAGLRSASEPYARLLAHTARDRFAAGWGLAETGATGPTGNRYGDAPGHACLALAGRTERAITLETGSADRVANMSDFAAAALELLIWGLNQ
jgi:nicotinamide-nucleotide amidase